jgi:hypothetical protein
MMRIAAFSAAVAFLLLGAAAQAEDRNAIATFRFEGPAKELTPVERQRALDYRSELQSQLRTLDQGDLRGRLDPLERRRLLDTRGELGRLNGVLLPPPSIAPAPAGSRTLPSLSGRSPLLAP